MKKLLSVLAGVMLFSMTARAQTCPEGCTACSGLECTSCAAGYYKTGIKCVKCPTGTWAKEGATECTACSEQKLLYRNAVSGVCASCTADGECTEYKCSAGYYKNGDRCAQCGPGTYSEAGASSCTVCPAGTTSNVSYGGTGCEPCGLGYWAERNGDYGFCTTCSQISIPNGKCTACTPDGTCTGITCNINYEADGMTCVEKAEKVEMDTSKRIGCNNCQEKYCIYYNSKEYICSASISINPCLNGTQPGQGNRCIDFEKCKKSNLHTHIYRQYNSTYFASCDCDSGYYRPWGALGDDDCLPCPANCKYCDRTGQCTSCYNNPGAWSYVKDGKCVGAEVRENVEMDNGICNVYRKDNVDWYCQKATCSDGKRSQYKRLYWTFENSVAPHYYCCPANCDACSDWGKCIRCESGYVLQNGKCVPECKWNEYWDESGQCQPCSNIKVANGVCRQCSADGTKCTDILCDDDSYSPDYESNACVKPVVCKYPLKEVADYSGECVGCCTE